MYALVIAILVGSNIATIYIYGLIDAKVDCQVENVQLENDNERLREENMQYQVGLQTLTEPSNLR